MMSQELQEELKLICRILLADANEFLGSPHQRRGLRKPAQDIFKIAQEWFRPINLSSLQTLFTNLPSKFDLGEHNGFLYLQPFQKSTLILPVLSLKFDNDSRLSISFKLILIVPFGAGIKAIGYRFENGDNTHEFYHVQHITRVGKNKLELPTAAWIPEASPTIPLEAGGPISLLLCMLGSIYGIELKGRLEELQRKNNGIKLNDIKKYSQSPNSLPLFLKQVC